MKKDETPIIGGLQTDILKIEDHVSRTSQASQEVHAKMTNEQGCDRILSIESKVSKDGVSEQEQQP